MAEKWDFVWHFKSERIWQYFNASKQKGFTSQPKDRYSSLNEVNQIPYNLNTYLMCNNMSNLDYLKFGYTLLLQILNKEQRTDSKLNYRVSQKKVPSVEIILLL
jgi:hypothetical protein